MRPDLVLDEDDKKRRFSKYKVPKEVTEESESEETEVQIVQVKPSKRNKKNANAKSKKSRSKSPDTKKDDSGCESSLKRSVSSMLPWPQSDSDNSIDDWLTFTTKVINSEDENSSDSVTESFLNPETGEVIDTESQTQKAEENAHIDNCSGGNTINVSNELEKDKQEKAQEGDSVQNTSCIHGRIIQHVSTTNTELRRKVEDDRIMKYIHKKFDNIEKKESTPEDQNIDKKHSIKKITIYNKSEPEKGHKSQAEGHSSVINYQPMRYNIFCS